MRKLNDFANTTIKDGKIYGLTLSYAFNVAISESENPQITPRVDCDGMPFELFAKKCWDAMKVSGRPSMKKLNHEKLMQVYHNQDISWRIMMSQKAASEHLAIASMSDDEMDNEIERLLELQKARKAESIQ